MAIDFPASPSVNDTFTSSGITYTWDGTVWAASGSAAFVVAAEGIDGLADVNTSTVAPTDGQVLTWDNANSRSRRMRSTQSTVSTLKPAQLSWTPTTSLKARPTSTASGQPSTAPTSNSKTELHSSTKATRPPMVMRSSS